MTAASASTEIVEDCITRFEAAWRDGGKPILGEFLPANGERRSQTLVELIHTDLEYRLRGGSCEAKGQGRQQPASEEHS